MSGVSSPFSSTTTVSVPASPTLKTPLDTLEQDVYCNPHTSASTLIEFVASRIRTSSTVYVYDLAKQVGFGILTKVWAVSRPDTAPVVELQTRVGAGIGLIGRLSEGSSQDAARGAVLTAYTTPAGLSVMAPSLTHLPSPSPEGRLVIHIPNVTSLVDSYALSPSLAALASLWSLLPDGVVVLLSSTPQQICDFAVLAHKMVYSHVIHIFDQFESARETGHFISPLPDGSLSSGHPSAIAALVSSAGYRFFDILGDKCAKNAIILLNGPLVRLAARLADHSSNLAVIVINVLRPWDETAFLDSLPGSVQNVHVIDDVPNPSTQGSLYTTIFSTLGHRAGVTVKGHRITPTQILEYLKDSHSFANLLNSVVHTIPPTSLHASPSKKIVFLGSPQSALPRMMENLFHSTNSVSVRALAYYDFISKHGGVAASRLLLSPKWAPHDSSSLHTCTAEGLEAVDFLAVLDHTLLTSHSIFEYSKPDTSVLLVTSWSSEELISNIPQEASAVILQKRLRVFTLNAKALSSKFSDAGLSNLIQNILVYLACVRLYLGSVATESKVLSVVQTALGAVVETTTSESLNSAAWFGVREVTFIPTKNESTIYKTSALKVFQFNSIAVETEDGDTVVNSTRLASWHDAAKHLLFPNVFTPEVESGPEEYPQNPSLRPEVGERTFLVTCSVNRRLTPLEYDRNVFHLEFDTTGTGLEYTVGEALGVYGWNDEKEVLEFCAWYDVNPSNLVTLQVPAGDGKMHTRTVLQALQQQIDLFGHPQKSFYTDLAGYAKSSADRHALLFIGSPEGSATYKKLSEKDTVTFVDILLQYPSAKPSIERLCEMIGDIKPRHYSIASAQSAVGNRVDLLVVTVEWKTPAGVPRYGQCTRYLAGLKVGQKVTVSIKPSVMKLPPNPKQPLILAGLGTGAAPFRAFFQHLDWLFSQGQEIGPVYYYFGSRHQASEYLYGEEIESYVLDGIITRTGLAFSRDGPQKVYIQHRMLEDDEALVQMLYENQGVFYLCGPTWPVPDVYEALVNALVKYKGVDITAAGDYLEHLKEEERYVLEVY